MLKINGSNSYNLWNQKLKSLNFGLLGKTFFLSRTLPIFIGEQASPKTCERISHHLHNPMVQNLILEKMEIKEDELQSVTAILITPRIKSYKLQQFIRESKDILPIEADLIFKVGKEAHRIKAKTPYTLRETQKIDKRIEEVIIGQFPKKEIALVLSGAGAKGPVYIPVLEHLLELGMTPEIGIGISAGALIWALYAVYDGNIEKVDEAFKKMEEAYYKVIKDYNWQELADYDPNWLKEKRSLTGIVQGEALMKVLEEAFMNSPLAQRIKEKEGKERPIYFHDLSFDLRLIAVDLNTMQRVVFCDPLQSSPEKKTPKELWQEEHEAYYFPKDIPLLTAVRASFSIPGIFKPVELEGMALVDGAIGSNLAILEAEKALGDHTLRKIRRLLLESFAKAYSEYERAKRALFTSLISEERKNQISDKFKEIEAKYQAAEEFFIKTRGETRKDYAEAKSNLKRVRNEFLALSDELLEERGEEELPFILDLRKTIKRFIWAKEDLLREIKIKEPGYVLAITPGYAGKWKGDFNQQNLLKILAQVEETISYRLSLSDIRRIKEGTPVRILNLGIFDVPLWEIGKAQIILEMAREKIKKFFYHFLNSDGILNQERFFSPWGTRENEAFPSPAWKGTKLGPNIIRLTHLQTFETKVDEMGMLWIKVEGGWMMVDEAVIPARAALTPTEWLFEQIKNTLLAAKWQVVGGLLKVFWKGVKKIFFPGS